MFSPEKSKRRASFERLKYCSGAQLVLSVGLIVCAIIATTKYDPDDSFGTPYFIGGYTCGVLGALAGGFGIYTTYKASFYDGDDVSVLRQMLCCPAITQMIMGYVVFLVAISGIMMVVLFLITLDNEKKIHVILAACILSGIVLLLVVTIISFTTSGTCCQCDEYNQMQTYPTTVGGNHYFQGQTAFGQHNVGQPGYNAGGFPITQNNFGMVNQQPTSFGLQQTVPTAPLPSY